MAKPRLLRKRETFIETSEGLTLRMHMRKVSRRRFIGLAMYNGLPARQAQECAALVNAYGVPYAFAYRILVMKIREVREEETYGMV
jgi:hypothetical protein